jgi:acyl-CoA thioesterase
VPASTFQESKVTHDIANYRNICIIFNAGSDAIRLCLHVRYLSEVPPPMAANSTLDANELARQCATAMYERDEASQGLGMKLVHISAGRATFAMKIEPWMANGDGVCHGGFLFSLADTAMAFASNSRNEVYVAVSASIEFLAPGRLGETMQAVATEEHRAGRTATYSVAVSDSSGARVAQLLGRTYRVKGNVIEGPRQV